MRHYHNYKLLIVQVCFMLIFCSCWNKNNTAKYSHEDLEGTWAIDIEKENILRNVSKDGHREYPSRHFMGYQLDIRGFYFNKDSCDYKAGFYDNTDIDNGLPLPIGFKTTYKIVGDTLKIWDLSKSEWQELLIQDLKSDTLILRELNYERFFNYIRLRDKPRVKQGYDEIVIAVISPDYLSDELYYLNKQGDYIYQKFDVRELDTLRYPICRYRLKSSELASIRRNFDFVDLESLKDEYFSSKLGDRSNYFLFFIKNDKIIKVVMDDDGVSPDELQWGYVPLMYLRRQVNIEHITDTKDCTACIKLSVRTPSIMKELKHRLGWDWDLIRARR